MVTANPWEAWGETGVGCTATASQQLPVNFPAGFFAKGRDELLVACNEGTIDDDKFVLL